MNSNTITAAELTALLAKANATSDDGTAAGLLETLVERFITDEAMTREEAIQTLAEQDSEWMSAGREFGVNVRVENGQVSVVWSAETDECTHTRLIDVIESAQNGGQAPDWFDAAWTQFAAPQCGAFSLQVATQIHDSLKAILMPSKDPSASTVPRCGALNRKGAACRCPAMKNGRCRNHGGLSTGAPVGNKNNYRHGFYYNALSAEEQELWPGAKSLGAGPAALEDELALMRIKLQRLLKVANDPDVAARIEQEIDVIIKAGVAPRGDDLGGYDKRELKTSLPRIGALIVEAVETIRKLSLSISQLKKDEKELLADVQDTDTDINVTINVVGGNS